VDKIVYGLCALTSGICVLLLFRGYLKTKMKLLLWSTVCFLCLMLSNILVYVDLIIYPDIDLFLVRNCLVTLGLGILIHGMIKETV
jgi:hypothetical protein